jgi:V/A-type H+/Na+-transporting ATPase subunit I
LIALALGLIGSFGEVVSYIRLFAVGMAGVAIADGFNAMAARIGVESVGAVIGSIFVVMLGHILCLALGPLSVLVHGIRLNLLEFSGHANISWSGLAYKPLKE